MGPIGAFLVLDRRHDAGHWLSMCNDDSREARKVGALTGVPAADLIASLSAAVDLAMGRRRGHSRATAGFASRLASRLGLPERQIRELALAALLKDAG